MDLVLKLSQIGLQVSSSTPRYPFYKSFLGGDSISWVLGPKKEGDCKKICKSKKAVCDESMGKKAALACDESMGKKAALAPQSINFKGIGCKGRNGWDFGQGFSQCIDRGCCGDSSCQYDCSATSKWPGCKIENSNYALIHHGRLCPCRVLGKSNWSRIWF